VSVVELLLLSLGLAMDATAVAISTGFAAGRVKPRDALKLALMFGGFQGAMPAIGAFASARVAGFVTAWADWIASGVLVAIGGHMIYEALASKDEAREQAKSDRFGWRVLAALAVATSIDALAAGTALPLLGMAVGPAVVMIGAVTFALSLGGVYLGRRFGERLGHKLDIVGGLTLIAIAGRIVIGRLSG
jgi:manganese efflux pump family protein